MGTLTLQIDGRSVESQQGATILEAADSAGIYIPRLCHHPDLPSADELCWAELVFQGNTRIVGERQGEKAAEAGHCNLCLVEVEGQAAPVRACITPVEDGLAVRSGTEEVSRQRKQALAKILSDHPHACLTCAQKQGCSRTDCSANVPVEERCCVLLGRCELEKVSDWIGIPADTPKYVPKGRPVIKADPLFERDFNLCVGCLRCVRACRDLRGLDVLGAVWKEGRAWVGTVRGPGLREAECRFCGACVEVCPTGALLDKETVPQVRRDTPLPCVAACPAGIDIPRYLHLIFLGRFREAVELIRERAPFVSVLGYVCFHPCEDVCRRADIDQPVAICALKRFAAENVLDGEYPFLHRRPETGKKVAVIGAGPAGLTAAYFLGALGHQVELFDTADEPGGMLRYAIPDYRLPPEVLRRELGALEKLGIKFQMKRKIDSQFGVAELKARGFDAVLIAAGTSASKQLTVENVNADGIYLGLDFLKSAKLSREPQLDGRVVVIGGGNVAVDAAMTAVRFGAREVDLVCLESRHEMAAHDWEIAQAEEEGIKVHPSWGPKRFTVIDGRVSGVELVKCTRVFDPQGRFDPQYDEGETAHISADYVIITIGQEVDGELFHNIKGLQKTPGGMLSVGDDYSTGIDGVFAAGDAVRGPSSVVEAIADGRAAADVIDKYLRGDGLDKTASVPAGVDKPTIDSSAESIQRPRQKTETAHPQKRKSGFGLIEQTFEEEAARLEAERCLRCHLRQMMRAVVLPPEQWFPLNAETVQSVPQTAGVFRLLDAEKNVIRIAGAANIRQELAECLGNPGQAKYFLWEEDAMYTKRESELIQQYLQEHGRLPGGGAGEDLDDLF